VAPVSSPGVPPELRTHAFKMTNLNEAFTRCWINVEIMISLLTGSQLFCAYQCGEFCSYDVEYKGLSLAGYRYNFLEGVEYVVGAGHLYSGFAEAGAAALAHALRSRRQAQDAHVAAPHGGQKPPRGDADAIDLRVVWSTFCKGRWDVGSADPCMRLTARFNQIVEKFRPKDWDKIKGKWPKNKDHSDCGLKPCEFKPIHMLKIMSHLPKEDLRFVQSKLGQCLREGDRAHAFRSLALALLFYRQEMRWEVVLPAHNDDGGIRGRGLNTPGLATMSKDLGKSMRGSFEVARSSVRNSLEASPITSLHVGNVMGELGKRSPMISERGASPLSRMGQSLKKGALMTSRATKGKGKESNADGVKGRRQCLVM